MLVIASRGSQLALWQARWVERQLTAAGCACRIEIIKTTGDKITDVPLAKVGTKGLFTKEIEEALLDGRADLAVHSLKDLPTELPAGLVLAAVPEREDPRDAVVGRPLADLPSGARVGTSSLRRAAQLRKLRGDLTVESVRGNLDTRLRKLDAGQYDAILLAAAGLKRLGWGGRIAEILGPEVMCPAVGQGALAIETRAAGPAFDACAALDHPATHAAVAAERGLLPRSAADARCPSAPTRPWTAATCFSKPWWPRPTARSWYAARRKARWAKRRWWDGDWAQSCWNAARAGSWKGSTVGRGRACPAPTVATQ